MKCLLQEIRLVYKTDSIVEKYRELKRKLYTIFIDLKKAYDSS